MPYKYPQPFGRRISGDLSGEGARFRGHGRCDTGHQPGWLSQRGINAV